LARKTVIGGVQNQIHHGSDTVIIAGLLDVNQIISVSMEEVSTETVKEFKSFGYIVK